MFKLPLLVPTPPPITHKSHVDFLGLKFKSEKWNETGKTIARTLDYFIYLILCLMAIQMVLGYLKG